ncbi:hypothetical protein Bca101_076015 [Brassica carinata]
MSGAELAVGWLSWQMIGTKAERRKLLLDSTHLYKKTQKDTYKMGGVKLLLIVGFLILAMVATSVNATYPLTKSCINGQGCIGDDDELESLMDSETNRRQLARGRRYIGYDALKKNNVPCNRRGRSYYDCKKRRRNNPYRRGCSAITHCYRYAK